MRQELLQTALLGTDKMKLSGTAYFMELGESESDKLLNAITGEYFYTSVSNQLVVEEQFPFIQIADAQESSSPEENDIIKSIIEFPIDIYEHLLNLWLQKITAKNKIIDVSITHAILDNLSKHKEKTQQNILAILGNKGTFILKHKLPEFSIPNEQNLNENFSSSALKPSTLLNSLNENIQSALELIIQNWNTESITTKKSLLKVLSQFQHPEVLNFVNQLNNIEFVLTTKSTKTVIECKQLCATILLQYNNSELFKYTANELKKYVNTAKGIFTKVFSSNKNLLQLPAQEDDFLNKENQRLHYGIEYSTGLAANFESNTYFFIAELFHLSSVSLLETVFEKDILTLAQSFMSNEYFLIKQQWGIQAVLEGAFVEMAFREKHKTLALFMLKNNKELRNKEVFELLDTEQMEKFILEQNDLIDYYQIKAIQEKNQLLSANFSSKWIQQSFDNYDKPQGIVDTNHLRTMALYLNIDAAIDSLDKCRSKNTKDYFDRWERNLYFPLYLVLEQRKNINKI